MMTPTLRDPISTLLSSVAESYVRLVLSIGEHDPDYVDAYYGPPEWRAEVRSAATSLESLRSSAQLLLEKLGEPREPFDEEIVRLRHQYLSQQIRSAISRIEMLRGRRFTFDEEALALYDAKPPVHAESFFREVLSSLDGIIPGPGTVAQRFDRYRQDFIISIDILDSVFQAAIRECRQRTQSRIDLPRNERFTVEYVTNKAWSGYNWYKGNSFSLIQINTDLPMYIDRAIDLAAHEGYPGHHVYNTLLERHLAQERGWVEFTVYALFSPQSLIAEGTANFGIEVAFPGDERVEFERALLFPAARLNDSETVRYYKIQRLTSTLNYAHNEAARGYLDGKMNRRQAEEFLVAYALMSPERAKQRVRFIDVYRSYVINYNLGQDLVRKHVESRGGSAANPSARWEEFKKLVSSPRIPSGL